MLNLLVGIAAKSAETPLPETSPNSPAFTLKEKTLLVGIQLSYPPMCSYAADGVTPVGFDIDFARKIGAGLGLTVEFIDVPWTQIFNGLDGGKYDVIISSVCTTDKRAKNYAFSTPYVLNRQVAVVHRSAFFYFYSPENVNGLKVAFEAKTLSAQLAAEISRKNIVFRQFPEAEITACFNKLRVGAVDVVFTDLPVALHYVKNEPMNFQIAWQAETAQPFGVVVRKNQPELLNAINTQIASMSADDSLAELADRYFGRNLIPANDE